MSEDTDEQIYIQQIEYLTKQLERQKSANRLMLTDATAKKVAELQAEREALIAENERMRETLEYLRDWAEAYPVEAFPEPDFEGVKAALLLHGFSLGEVSASSYRYLLSRIKDVVEKALKGGEK